MEAAFSVDWPAWSLVKAAEQQPGEGPTDDLIASAMAAARMAEPYRELLAATELEWVMSGPFA